MTFKYIWIHLSHLDRSYPLIPSSCLFLSLCQNLNANPMEDDYLSHVSYMFSFLRVKWLKVSDAKGTRTLTGTSELAVLVIE